MKMVEVDETTFNMILEKSEAQEGGSDVGRTHGITVWNRCGRYNYTKAIAVRSWYIENGVRIWGYEVANYLYEAYKGE